jgi:hypothetical protein
VGEAKEMKNAGKKTEKVIGRIFRRVCGGCLCSCAWKNKPLKMIEEGKRKEAVFVGLFGYDEIKSRKN